VAVVDTIGLYCRTTSVDCGFVLCELVEGLQAPYPEITGDYRREEGAALVPVVMDIKVVGRYCNEHCGYEMSNGARVLC